ncbi:MAG: TolC family protein [Sulfurovum sp.]|nr:TolC family protein [Sulfurovum sp.]
MKKILYLSLLAGVISVGASAQTLQNLIDYAMKHATVIKKSEAQMALSKMKHQESKADQFGSIDLVGGFTHYNLPRTLAPMTPSSIAAGGAVATTKDLYSAGITYTVPLFTGFAQTTQVEMDNIATAMAQSKLSLTKEQLAYNVASLYLSILALEDMAQAQQKYVYALKKLKNIIAKEVSLGKKAQIDLLKAQKDLAGNLSYLEVLKGNLSITKASLASLVGIDHIGTLKRVKISVKQPRIALGELMAKADSLNRIKVADFNVKKADRGIKKSRSTLMPQVVLNSYYGYNYGENDSSNPASGEWNNEKLWQVGVNAQWKVFDFGKRDATIQKAKIAKMEAEFDREQTLLDLKKSLIEAREKMRQEYANYQGNLKQLALAKASEKIERVRYENGASTINDLLYAVSQTQLAKAKLIESKYNYQKGKFYLDYLLERGIRK